jgi:hypothetical protein
MTSRWLTSLLAFNLTLAAAVADSAELNPAALAYKLPDQLQWRDPTGAAGVNQAILQGDPSKPGLYVVLNRFKPGNFSRPHFHPKDRFITVVKGTWWVATGNRFDPATETVPMPAGSFVTHFANPAGLIDPAIVPLRRIVGAGDDDDRHRPLRLAVVALVVGHAGDDRGRRRNDVVEHAGQGERQEAAARYTENVYPGGVGDVVLDQVRDQAAQEAHIVDGFALNRRHRQDDRAAVAPLPVDRVGIDRDEALAIGERIEPRPTTEIGAGSALAVQHDDQRTRTRRCRCRPMQHGRALHALMRELDDLARRGAVPEGGRQPPEQGGERPARDRHVSIPWR